MVNTDNFYLAFEDRYRGSRELIKSRLLVYLPFILPLQQFYPFSQGIDLGCGRGEWLEIMQENGIAVQGVDVDQSMLAVAQKHGLNVVQGDAIEKLQILSSESQTLVSGFHLAEHLAFETLHLLIQESLRVLKPGGLLILETPNPENITVGTESFYLDPSHYRPIPSQSLLFMAEYAGFKKVKVLRLQEPAGLAGTSSLSLLSVLNGVSPDYAIIAQKECSIEIQTATASAFETDYGLSLETLANNYDRQIKVLIQLAEARAQQAEAKAQQVDVKAQQIEANLNRLSSQITAPFRAVKRLLRL
jgi:O-antigen chain-terminating methyltransferase